MTWLYPKQKPQRIGWGFHRPRIYLAVSDSSVAVMPLHYDELRSREPTSPRGAQVVELSCVGNPSLDSHLHHTGPPKPLVSVLGPMFTIFLLCAVALHALGLVALGSQIDLAHTTVWVRGGGGLPAFTGEGALLYHTTSEALRAILGTLAATDLLSRRAGGGTSRAATWQHLPIRLISRGTENDRAGRADQLSAAPQQALPPQRGHPLQPALPNADPADRAAPDLASASKAERGS
jgi:hypothetical protein